MKLILDLQLVVVVVVVVLRACEIFGWIVFNSACNLNNILTLYVPVTKILKFNKILDEGEHLKI